MNSNKRYRFPPDIVRRKKSACFGAVLAAILIAILPSGSAFGDDACTASPCLNGGVCSTIDTWGYSCSCTADFLGPNCSYPAAVGEQITAQYYSRNNGTTSLGWWDSSSEESGYGQSFSTTTGGILAKVSFDVYPSEESVNKPEPLIVEVWNVDGSGIPNGSPLASRSLDGSSFIPEDITQVGTVDFSADQVKLKPYTQYAFTLRVEHKSTTEGYTMYGIPRHLAAPDEYPGGKMIRSRDGQSWQIDQGNNTYDWHIFQVTVLAPLFENSFEEVPVEP